MEIKIKRTTRAAAYTEGHLYINNVYICDTLEPTNKRLTQDMDARQIRRYKYAMRAIGRKCAIPSGTYPVEITYSPHFKCMLPLVGNVTGFTGIRIHVGNTVSDTEGCILVGKRTRPGIILYSRNALARVVSLIKQAGGKATLVIVS